MSYNYDALEQVLELAAYRLPVRVVGNLISKAEYVISMNANSQELENEIQDLLGKVSVFSLKKVDILDQVFSSAAA